MVLGHLTLRLQEKLHCCSLSMSDGSNSAVGQKRSDTQKNALVRCHRGHGGAGGGRGEGVDVPSGCQPSALRSLLSGTLSGLRVSSQAAN